MTRLRILFITLFSILVYWAGAQQIDSLISYADRQFAAGQYNLAAKEYQRALFFGPTESVGLFTLKTGDCFFNQENYAEAEKYYRFAANIIGGDSLRFEAHAKKVVCLVHQELYQQAILDIYSMNTDFSAEAERQKEFLLGSCFFGLSDFKRAEEHFLRSIENADSVKKESVHTLLTSKKLIKPDPQKAYWMSIFLPGLGQVYSGDYKNGINSALLYFGFMGLLLNMTYSSGWVDAIFTVAPWWQRYYTGGYNNARKIATAKRQSNRAEIYQQLYHLINY